MQEHKITLDLFGQQITLKTGKLAKQANAAVLVESHDTVILSAATMGKNAVEDPGFFPLSVHYIEKFYAAGKIPGGFVKREGKPSDKAILTSRIIDRSLRPLFPEGFRNEVQVIPNVLSIGDDYAADVLGLLASSAALYISDIPFHEPVGCVRVTMEDGKLVLNKKKAKEDSSLDLTISGTKDGVTMIEGISKIISNETMLEAIEFGFKAIQQLVAAQEELRKLVGKEKIVPPLFKADKNLEDEVRQFAEQKILDTFAIKEKVVRYKAVDILFQEIQSHFQEKYNDSSIAKQAKNLAHDLEYLLVRENLFKTNLRVDGRKTDEIRHIEAEAGVFNRLHGSALFTRGETQALGVLTLGSMSDQQKVEDINSSETQKAYMLHYNFPSFSVGEAGRVGPPGRREIGHGYLAEKSLVAVLPKASEFPYTIRLVSEILESNGSSSMATVCACSLALMDGGVPIKENVAGIAMGLMFNENKSDYRILTDIQGLEDHYGDIDFKVAGTKDGITAFQLDIKMDAVSIDILKEALEASYKARITILEKMNKVMSTPRQELSTFAPSIIHIKANPDNIRYLIGPSGKTIKGLSEEFGIAIDVLPTGGEVHIVAPTQAIGELAKEKILFIVRDVKVNDIIEGIVKKISPFGAFIEVAAGREGLCHISKISTERVNAVEDILKEGMQVRVKVLDIDKQDKISLSIKDV